MIKILRISLLELCLLIHGIAVQGQVLNDTPLVTNGSVRAIARNSSTIYVGGDFTAVGRKTGNGIVVDPVSGKQTGNLKSDVNQQVQVAIADGSGGWYIGGRFTRVGETGRELLAHVLADGSVDSNFAFNLTTTPETSMGTPMVSSLCIAGNRLYVGGMFTRVNGIARFNFAAIDLSSNQLIEWSPVVMGKVASLVTSGNTIIAGGDFYEVNGQARRNIAAFDLATGELTNWNPGVSGEISAMAVDGNSVYVGGLFDAVGDIYRDKIAQIDLTTGRALDFTLPIAANINAPYVTALVIRNGILYVGGYFNALGGVERNYAASVRLSTGELTDWHPNFNAVLFALAAHENTIFAGGLFTRVGEQPRDHAAAFDATTGTLTQWSPNVSNPVRACSPTRTGIYLGGDFNTADSQPRANLAAIDALTGQLKNWNPAPGFRVHAIALAGEVVYVAGSIVRDNIIQRRGLFAVHATTGEIISSFPTTDGEVFALAVVDDVLYAGGNFTRIGEQNRRGLAAIDLGTGQVTDWNPDCDGAVKVIASWGKTIYVAGYYNLVDGQERGGLSSFDVTTGRLTSWNPDLDLYVYALALKAGTVYAGGMAHGGATDPVKRKVLFAVDAVTGATLDWNPALNFYVVDALALQGRNLYASGSTPDYNQLFSQGIVEIDTQTEQVASSHRTIGRTLALTAWNEHIHAGGDFTSFLTNGQYAFQPYLAAFKVTAITTNTVEGSVFNHGSADCAAGGSKEGLKNMVVVARPGPYFGLTDSLGKYSIAVDTGTYTIEPLLPPTGTYATDKPCPASALAHTVTFKSYNNTVTGKDFNRHLIWRPHLTASVTSTSRRRCFPSVTTLSYCNTGSGTATDVKVHLQLPEYVVLISANAPYTRDNDKHYVFSLGQLDAGGCGSIQVRDSVVCNDPNIRGLTQCTRVWITPANGTTPAPEWDRSDITLKARCLPNGMVRLGIYNTGTGSMADSAGFRILLDAGLALGRNFKLAAGDSLILRVPANGRTVRLEADQRPGHPTKSATNVTLEACGTNASGGVSLGFVAQLPCDDAEPEVAEECLPITDSFDPNDKLVRPAGTTPEHYTPTGTALSYTVRFQNTGNDYAYKVVVVDTLAAELDLRTLQMGAVSHPYKFTVSGKGRPVLSWTFNDINLPDSTRDEAGSNGFIQFSIKPLADLPEKTRVENFADIFFDYNPPVRTNTTFNRIYDVPPVVAPADRLEAAAVVATPVITGFTPAAGAAGTVVTLTGRHFDPVPGNNRVTFNGIAATVTAATATTLSVTVPPGEVAGRIRVTTSDGAALSTTSFSLLVPPPTAVTPGLPAGLVRIYPNPAPGRFVVEFAQPASGVTEIVTLDARGQRVHTLPLTGKPATRAEIDLKGHPAGMYLVLIRTEQGITTRKVTLRP